MATREEKVRKKIERSQRRRQKRYDKTASKIGRKMEAFQMHGFKAINNYNDIWEENGRLVQICSYMGICAYPCNGDC